MIGDPDGKGGYTLRLYWNPLVLWIWLGAAAMALGGIVSLTDRRLGSALAFLTAQRCKGNPPPNWKAVAELGGAVAIYMPGGHEATLARELMDGGLSPETPCFVVSQATRPEEQIVETTVGELPKVPQLPAPALLLIGVVPARKPHTSSKIVMNSKSKFI